MGNLVWAVWRLERLFGGLWNGFLPATEFDEPRGFGHEGVIEEGLEGPLDCLHVGTLFVGEDALIDESSDLGSVHWDGYADEALFSSGTEASDADG